MFSSERRRNSSAQMARGFERRRGLLKELEPLGLVGEVKGEQIHRVALASQVAALARQRQCLGGSLVGLGRAVEGTEGAALIQQRTAAVLQVAQGLETGRRLLQVGQRCGQVVAHLQLRVAQSGQAVRFERRPAALRRAAFSAACAAARLACASPRRCCN